MTDGGIHSFPMRAYLEDTDSGVVVCFANYLKYGAGARIELKLGRMTPKHVRA